MNSEQMLEKANQLWQSLEAKDREWLRERKPSLDSAQMALMEVDEAIRTLKSWTITHQFETWQEEIAFFKVAKPKFIASSRTRIEFLRILPDFPARPNSAPFSRVRRNAGSFWIRSAETPPFSLAI